MDSNLSSQVELWVSCKNLPNLDVLSKSDPFAVLRMKGPTDKGFVEIGRTETIRDDPNPHFRKSFKLQYHFEEIQTLRLEVYDSDSSSTDLKKHDYIGFVEVSLAEVVAAPGQAVQAALAGRRGGQVKNAVITIRAEEHAEGAAQVDIMMVGRALAKMDFLGLSDPYVEIYRVLESGAEIQVHRTEVIKQNLNPNWKPISMKLKTLCGGDMKAPIRFKCFDWDRIGEPDFIGEATTTAAELIRNVMANKEAPLQLRRPNAKKAKSRAKERGRLVIQKFHLVKLHTFLDFIKGGMQIGLMVAIDFTASNGAPSTPGSLHYLSAEPNQYQSAIRAVGDIVAPYDSDQRFPVWGFGGQVRGTPKASHCFNLTFDPNHQEVAGVDGVLAAYENAMSCVSLSGPTYFSEVLDTAIKVASEPQRPGHQHYSILLIITDGVIMDMTQTVQRIVRASVLPLSIIIVGVGQQDFSSMEILDADDQALSSNGMTAKRDIVQFVPFRKFIAAPSSYLAKETLAEVPTQLMQYAAHADLQPMPARKALDIVRAPPAFKASNEPAPAFQSSAQTPDQAAPPFQQFPPGFQQPPPGFQQPPPGFQQAPPSFQPTGFQAPPPGFQQMPPGYEQGFQQPPPGFQAPPPGFQPQFQQSPPGFQQSPPDFQQQPPTAPQPSSAAKPHKGVAAPGAAEYTEILGVIHARKNGQS